ncbi:hypothetical protein [Paenibacillus glacialis]|uniref:Copper amine oxidase-like N-terminal domain-containing protein n=1 Tax=Paenibacillus glacialis TaxID=494026 RepID=A0A162K926_9BACL|nr:hypothetical protein [Paenibacillus glacialis]OAB42398.1 hypothetical protein PGLA_12030 [Paenibacillus glacialis]
MKLTRLFGLMCAGVFATSSLSMVASAADVGSDNPASTTVVMTAEVAEVNGSWHEVSKQTFWLLEALERGQGVTTDGNSWIFSSPYGLLRTALDGKTVKARNQLAIPSEISALGGDHIGDISYYNDTIYAPIEDGKHYEHPYIALYDANTLQYTGTSFALPLDLHIGGVPWVAVDAVRGQVYTAQWSNASVLNVFSLDDMHLIRTVPLTQSIDRIQGAEMYNGILYASSDNGTQTVYQIDTDTGSVSVAFDRNLPSGTEAQGIAVLPTANGAELHILDVGSNRISLNFRHYAF